MTAQSIIQWFKSKLCFCVSTPKPTVYPSFIREFPFGTVNLSTDVTCVNYRQSSSRSNLDLSEKHGISFGYNIEDTRNPVIDGITNERRADLGLMFNARKRMSLSFGSNHEGTRTTTGTRTKTRTRTGTRTRKKMCKSFDGCVRTTEAQSTEYKQTNLFKPSADSNVELDESERETRPTKVQSSPLLFIERGL